VIHLLLCLLLQDKPLPPAGPVPAPPPEASETILSPFHGSISMRYRYQRTSTESDSDLYEVLSFSYGNASKDPIIAVLTARLAEDLDGNRSVQGYYPFSSVEDSYHHSATEQLYTAYLEVPALLEGLSVRGGRQYLEDIPEGVLMDGGSVKIRSGTLLSLSLYGGLPANLYESASSGDAMYGAATEVSIDGTVRGRYRVEYLHIKDENVYGLHEDDLLGFSIDESSGAFGFYARYTMLEWESRDLVGRLTASLPEDGVQLQFQATYVFQRIEVHAYALDPYASFMMAMEPYIDLTARGSKSFGREFSLDAVFTARKLVQGATESTYNHEFLRFNVSPRVTVQDVSVSVGADYWNSTVDDFWTLSGDIAWAIRKDLSLSAGSSYALYSIDAFTGEEHDRVRTYSVQLKWKFAAATTLDVRFILEQNDIDTFHIIDVGVRHAF
jgi:hypothetical protein